MHDPRAKLLLALLFLFCVRVVRLKRLEDICVNDTDCQDPSEEATTNDTLANSTTTEAAQATETTQTTQTTQSSITEAPTGQTDPLEASFRNLTSTARRVQFEICDCDLTVSTCDVNCCCDQDCTDFQMTVFSKCEDRPSELYDSRYCYNRNFLERNNTPFILEKLANNLFCILYDNLPPAYSVSNELKIQTPKDFEEAMTKDRPSWKWYRKLQDVELNETAFYKDGDVLWRIRKDIIEPIELPQLGFTGLCSFKKRIRYLQEWEESCLQANLSESNEFLFPATFSNFIVLRLPNLINQTRLQVCPRNVCLPLKIYHCQTNTWSNCSEDIKSNVSTFCGNTTCSNVVKAVKYQFHHNGTAGIHQVGVYFHLDNVSSSFYQKFEVKFQWLGLKRNESLRLSGNPGYVVGKPILLGAFAPNKTQDKKETRYIMVNETDGFLTLAKAKRSGECDSENRYTVLFGEDVKLKCSLSFATKNFTSATCMDLQEEAMNLLLQRTMVDLNETSNYGVFVSKLGNFTDNRTHSWTRILLDRIPGNVVTGQTRRGQLYCSGLVTSIHVGILHASLKKPESLRNHRILAAGIKFADEQDLSWKKCQTENCTDILRLDLVSFVTFHDVSKPSRYYFVGAPNLDLTLPYDFFYPFLSSSAGTLTSYYLFSKGFSFFAVFFYFANF